MVWNETARIVNGLFKTVWDGRDVVTVDHCLDITLPVGLLFPIHYKSFIFRLLCLSSVPQVRKTISCGFT